MSLILVILVVIVLQKLFYPMPHHYVLSTEESYAATCTNNGLNVYYCDNICYSSQCRDRITETIPDKGHQYKSEIKKKATCTEDGYIKQICSTCNEEHQKIIKALGHDVKFFIVKEPLCTEKGEKSGVCSRCNEEIIEKIPALGHSYPEEWTVSKKPG